MRKIDITHFGLGFTVVFDNDGEPYEIRNDHGHDIQHVFTRTATELIYAHAWDLLNDPQNEADHCE